MRKRRRGDLGRAASEVGAAPAVTLDDGVVTVAVTDAEPVGVVTVAELVVAARSASSPPPPIEESTMKPAATSRTPITASWARGLLLSFSLIRPLI